MVRIPAPIAPPTSMRGRTVTPAIPQARTQTSATLMNAVRHGAAHTASEAPAR